ncbi:hypothetical protein HAX54_023002 [Datura stramonium]|uniref:Uncharacterized protein n=1 Tax=Datura stramonium TaxID=4076 RepID=A0ABS8UXJ6_DATST|nr:hypothetical protein [Datura stramonium]
MKEERREIWWCSGEGRRWILAGGGGVWTEDGMKLIRYGSQETATMDSTVNFPVRYGGTPTFTTVSL